MLERDPDAAAENIKQEEKQKQNTEETVEIYLPSLQIAKLWEVTVNVYDDMFRDKPINRGGTYLTKINFSKFYPQFLMVLYVS